MSEQKSSNKKDAKSYVVFARKFRPQIFDEVKGQSAVVETLKNAISQNRTPQSFLFTGTRGVGKTSLARILAKSLNCEKGPTITPCGKCSSCLEITESRSLDVIEIDGASNNSVENVRDLRENIAMSPVGGQFKIYIIDEVHMLSQSAFNALLKTLEEPPSHAKFIFATTDAHKVPATIVSRCQRFAFRRIPAETIVEKLTAIAKNEKITVEDKALLLIAKAGDGSLRDGESLLDQISSFSKGKITTALVEETLGLASIDLYISLLKAWGKKDGSKALQIFETAFEGGLELLPFTKGLYEMVRNFLILKVHPNPKGLIDLTPDVIKEIKRETEDFTAEGLLAISTGLEKLLQTVQYSGAARFALETAIVKFASIGDAASIPELLKKLEKLEKSGQLEKKTKLQRVTASAQSAEVQSNPAPSQAPEAKSTPSAAPIRRPAPAAPAPQKVSDGKKVFFTLSQVEAIWPQVIEEVSQKKVTIGTSLGEAEPIETEEGCLVLGFPEEFKFHKESIEKQEIKELIEASLKSALGAPISLKVVLTTTNTKKIETPKKTEAEAEDRQPGEVSPIVESALNIFKSGRIVRND